MSYLLSCLNVLYFLTNFNLFKGEKLFQLVSKPKKTDKCVGGATEN